jgi:DNA-binding MarR family transcriptional regulator
MAENLVQVQEVANLYLDIMQNLNISVTPEWLQLDLTFQQMKVLYILKQHGTLKMKELHEKLGVSMPTITGIVNRLIERKDGIPLLSREASPDDRREVWAKLTLAGVETTETLNELNTKLVEHAINRLGHTELNGLKAGLQALLRAVQDLRQEAGTSKSDLAASGGRLRSNRRNYQRPHTPTSKLHFSAEAPNIHQNQAVVAATN